MKDTARLVDELEQEINERKELIAQMVGPSYPNILQIVQLHHLLCKEISRLEKAKFELMKK